MAARASSLLISSHAKRSLVKAATFRSIILIADVVVIYAMTRRVDMTVGLTIATNVVSTALYYLHERVWNAIQWGRGPKSLDRSLRSE